MLALAHALWGMSVGWNAPLAGNGTGFFHIHDFRQSQNAIAVYWMLHGGNWIDYEIPLFGPPWSMPLEMPIYEWTVAVLIKLTGVAIEPAGRWVCAGYFFAALWLLYLLLKEIGIALSGRLIVLTFILASPVYIFWSRTFMIESAAVFFGVAYLYAAARFINTGLSNRWMAAAALFGALAALAKVTTYVGFAFGLGLYFAWRMSGMLRNRTHIGALLAEAGRALIVLGVPLVCLSIWTHHADWVKAQNPLTEFQSSGQIFHWLTGTIPEKLAYLAPTSPFWYRMVYQILGGFGPVVVAAAGFLWLRPRRVSPWAYIAFGCFLIVLVVFTKVQAIHNYYQYANALFLLICVGILADQLLARSDWASRGLGAGLIAVTVLSCLWTYHRAVLPTQIYAFRPEDSLSAMIQAGKAIQQLTEPSDVLVTDGLDWNPFLPFYSERRALVIGIPGLPDANPNGQSFKDALSRIDRGRFRVAAAALCGTKRHTEFKSQLVAALGLLANAAYSNMFCDVYVRQWPAGAEPRLLQSQQGNYYFYLYRGQSFATPVNAGRGEYFWDRPPAMGDPVIEASMLDELEPKLLESYSGYNILKFHQRYYALPQKFGPVNFSASDPATSPGVLVAASRDETINRIMQAVAANSEGPVLLQSVDKTNIVLFRGRYYGIPQSLGEVRWDTDVATLPGVVVAGSLADVLARIAH